VRFRSGGEKPSQVVHAAGVSRIDVNGAVQRPPGILVTMGINTGASFAAVQLSQERLAHVAFPGEFDADIDLLQRVVLALDQDQHGRLQKMGAPVIRIRVDDRINSGKRLGRLPGFGQLKSFIQPGLANAHPLLPDFTPTLSGLAEQRTSTQQAERRQDKNVPPNGAGSCMLHTFTAAMQRTSIPIRIPVFGVLYLVLIALPLVKASASTEGVLLSRTTGNHLFAPVLVNRKPAWFAVDTGAALTIVDAKKAHILGLSSLGKTVELPSQIEVNDRVVPVANLQNLSLGTQSLGSGPVALIDLTSFRARLRNDGTAVPMDGILGLDILERYRAIIDCSQQRIYLQIGSPADLSAVEMDIRKRHLKSIPMRITRSGALEIEGNLNGKRYSFVVDTGGFTTLLPLAVARESGIPIIHTGVNAKGIHSKTRAVMAGIAPQMGIGRYSLGTTVVGITDLPPGPEDLRYQFGGLLGADFFFQHHGIIDVGNQKLYFTELAAGG
jgi:predicted aspartyl protease